VCGVLMQNTFEVNINFVPWHGPVSTFEAGRQSVLEESIDDLLHIIPQLLQA